ncbi:indolepyruvate ferredoxin oxidoreductase family protein [Chromobacterium sp. IIBBL 290-4]|uniref:indolepyruvate ferredoxin oxidoreductase family protein n=1 Tax=Chromobacterium sp. IIBBL 290-4 TaxID=2953890 RepID=UPI0020B807EA|nr:indolepyruvate ferredoxin oxidoreductase family protein [Chromobacterium sp. IIBBL 290-4]UTH75979.1 indolepyruvate ferredoxin oxidoreductase family protein [Chromobacterium sp. IIBBL 290-4]
MSIRHADLEEKYTAPTGQVLMTGIQALVRLPMLQQQLDQAAGLNTAGYVTGYRGSPLGNVDQTMLKAKKHLDEHQVVFHPGLNEDLAATAIWGTQQVNMFEGAKYDGVYSMWYGKGPGVDRSGDVLKHGNVAGTSRHGGVLLVCGDDHAAKSSTFPHQSDHILAASMIPVLSPSGVQEVLDFGLHGWAMSRYSGCWVSIKAITDTIESSAIVDISPERFQFKIPQDFPLPEDGLNIRWPDTPLAQEKRVLHHRLYAALAYARENKLNHITLDSPKARLGIITCGKSYLDVMQALDDLGISEAQAAEIGLRIFKVGMVWPLEPEGVRQFAQGLEEILVVEEKRQIIEYQLKEQLYNWRDDMRPRVVGKFAEKGEWALPHGDWLLPAAGELTPAMIARALASRLAKIYDSPVIHDRLKFYDDKEAQLVKPRESIARVPHYCSGCPHNTSTKLPEGSRAVAGIGCHYMAHWISPENTKTFTQMGGEGITWLGQAPFTTTKHIFTNLGDGTYFHSGILAIRAAVAGKVNITYKILYNDAVAMTGGQHVDGYLDVPMMTRQLAAEGVKRIVITSDDPDKYQHAQGLAAGIDVFHRRELDRVQRELRDTEGVTILIHDQTCAAEKRRRRKRNEFPDPAKRAFINERVCEGCGDCSKKSGCLSVLPQETPLGRKRKIDQSSCNKDYSCVEGFCPSFVTVEGGKLKKPAGASADLAKMPALPEPKIPEVHEPFGIMVTGVGGTGVVTIGQVLGMAAYLDNKGVTVLDMAGLAQKGGSVWSHVRIADSQEKLHAVRIAAGDANLVLGCDLVVTAAEEALAKMREGFSHAIVNNYESPTSGFLKNPDLRFPAKAMKDAIIESVGSGRFNEVNANKLATALMGDAIASNMFMLGYAWQKGLVPVSLEAIMEAVRLNGAAVKFNQDAFSWGRHAAHDQARVEALVTPSAVVQFVPRETPDAVVHHRATLLTAYQNEALAERYKALVQQVKQAEEAVNPGSSALTLAAARVYYHLLAYKDEYEVARLYSDGEFLRDVASQFDGDYKLRFHIGVAWLTGGQARKIPFGPWLMPAMKLLAKFRFLRGGALDPFAWQADRKLERQLIAEFEQGLPGQLASLTAETLPRAAEWIKTWEGVRGFGHIKLANYQQARARQAELNGQAQQPAPAKASAAVA